MKDTRSWYVKTRNNNTNFTDLLIENAEKNFDVVRNFSVLYHVLTTLF